jgi:hypothetical protein
MDGSMTIGDGAGIVGWNTAPLVVATTGTGSNDDRYVGV